MTTTLVIETATAACSVALLRDGAVVAATHEVVGRGHAERLVPMIAALPGGGRADSILVDVGPGSFTGVRVGLAAAQGLAIGWKCPLAGYSSLALLAATGFAAAPHRTALAVVLEGGHGEVFMQGFTAPPLTADGPLRSLKPADALAALGSRGAIGNGVRHLVSLAPDLDLTETLPNAADAVLLPAELAALPATPIYGRAPDARTLAERGTCMSTTLNIIELREGGLQDLGEVNRIMQAAFDVRYGEGWTSAQCLGMLSLPGVWLTIGSIDGRDMGFALSRAAADEGELLLLATHPAGRGRGVGGALLRAVVLETRARGARQLHLEVRAGNDAVRLYRREGFDKVGERRQYYRGKSGQLYDAHTYSRSLS